MVGLVVEAMGYIDYMDYMGYKTLHNFDSTKAA